MSTAAITVKIIKSFLAGMIILTLATPTLATPTMLSTTSKPRASQLHQN